MTILNGLKNFLEFINNNWTLITIIIGLGLMVYKKIRDYLSKSDEEKIELAKSQLQTVILSMVSEAEKSYADFKGSGSVKRAQVISEIYQQYPILNKVADQEELLKYIDELIDEALKTVREVVTVKGEEGSKNG